MVKAIKKIKNGIKIPKKGVIQQNILAPKGMFDGIPVGLAEHYGLDFDGAFGLGKGDAPKTFREKVGIDVNFGKQSFDVGFSKAFMEGEFMEEEPALISQNYDEPSQYDMADQYSKEVPNLIESTKKFSKGKRIPLTDEQEQRMSARRKREIAPRSKFVDDRVKEIQAGSNFLSPEEARLYESGYTPDGVRYDTRRRNAVGGDIGNTGGLGDLF